MTRKRYSISGYVEYSTIVRVGSANVRIDFTGGQKSSLHGTRPATYTTTCSFLQDAIENSYKFQKGLIKLDYAEGESTKAEEEDESLSNSSAKQDTEFKEITNTQMVKEILMKTYNVPLSQLQNKESIKAKAAELKVKFPNWK